MGFDRNFLIVLILLGISLFSPACSGGGDDDDDSDASTSTSSSALSLDEECFACTQSTTTGDECGSTMITGSASEFDFDQIGSAASVDINGEIQLTGTYIENRLSLLNDNTTYIGPGCQLSFNNIVLTATINSSAQLTTGWVGTMSYDVVIDTSDSDCDWYPFSECHAVHQLSCSPGC